MLTYVHFQYSFEHSLVQELGYNGYERLRRGFDRAFGGQENVPMFALVIDAGCGTGLVGEQVRAVSDIIRGSVFPVSKRDFLRSYSYL
jgi:predicted TPR repeat methyltransferase